MSQVHFADDSYRVFCRPRFDRSSSSVAAWFTENVTPDSTLSRIENKPCQIQSGDRDVRSNSTSHHPEFCRKRLMMISVPMNHIHKETVADSLPAADIVGELGMASVGTLNCLSLDALWFPRSAIGASKHVKRLASPPNGRERGLR